VTQRRLRSIAFCFLAWTVVGLFFASQGLAQKFFTRDPTPWWHYIVSYLIGVYISAALTPGVIWLGRRFPFERKIWARRLALHLLCSVAFAVIQLLVESAILSRLGLFPTVMKGYAGTLIVLSILGFHQSALSYFTVLGILYALQYYRKYQERERDALRLELHSSELKSQLTTAQLSALKMQLQPHFLFNTLNAIMVLVRQQRGRQAEQTLSLLSDLLRCVLDDVENQEVPLRRELEYLQLYLSIERVRFQDRLHIDISADPAILEAAVPHMALQPLVENAIRHGIGRSSAAGSIRIRAARVNRMLELRVQDDGPGLPPAHTSQGHGIGLANTRARLRQLYGDAGQLTLENGEHGGAVATMILPYHAAPRITESEVMEVHAFDDADR
jgi:two-component system LytT family sensor kinase